MDPAKIPLRSIRNSEMVALGFFAYELAASWLFPLTTGQRLKIAVLNLLAASVILLVARFASGARRPFVAMLRNWLPCLLIILAYRESGLFLSPDVTHGWDSLFIRWDRFLLGNALVQKLIAFCSPWLERYFELAYLLTYPFVPLGFAAVYFSRSSGSTPDAASGEKPLDRFWTTVLLAALASYALFPFFPLTPPRVLFNDLPWPAGKPLLRKMNFWILDRYSVQACLFPSGHVAGGTATALAVWAERPRLGLVFLFAAASIAASTVFGRYHYSADAVAGAILGIAAYAVSSRIHSTRFSSVLSKT
jgi:membrane-associated phospholipid phosphatase